MTKVIHNGTLIDKSEANVSVYDKGYFFDFSVYSSLKVIKGKVFFPEYHIERLFESAKLLGLGHSFTKEEILRWLSDLVEVDKIEDGLLRMLLIGDTEENVGANLFIFQVSGLTYYPNEYYSKGAKVITYEAERRIPGAKSKDLLMSFLAYREAKSSGAIDALLTDHRGNILEGTRTNFFAIKGDTVITPPSELVLEGITRKLVLQSIEGHFKIKEKNIAAKDLDKYDEFFITSTSMNVMPISQIDGKKVGKSSSKTKKIINLFRDYYHKEVLGE